MFNVFRDGGLVSVELALVCYMIGVKSVSDQCERSFASAFFALSEKLAGVLGSFTAHLVSRNLFRNPEAGFVVQQSVEVLLVAFDLQEYLVCSPCVADLWSDLVEVLVHESRVFLYPVEDGSVADIYSD